MRAHTVDSGVIYFINSKWTFAIDAETGRQIWRTPVKLEPDVKRNAYNRGAAVIFNPKLFRVTIDNHAVPLAMKTGEELWNQKYPPLQAPYYSTLRPPSLTP